MSQIKQKRISWKEYEKLRKNPEFREVYQYRFYEHTLPNELGNLGDTRYIYGPS